MVSDAWKAHAALLLVQLNYGGYHVIAKLALSGGINQLVFCVLRDVVALTILGPLAYVKDKETRPIFSGYFLFSFFFLGLTGIFGNQLLFTLGLNFTSPAYAAALQPAIPVFTFLLALTVGTETVNWQRIDGKAKVGGVLVCVAGAMVMALYKGPVLLGDGFSDLNLQGMAMAGKPAPEPVSWLATLLIDAGVDMWHIGVVCLIGNCFCLATYIVYQAPLLSNYPALSMTAYSYLFGAGLMSLTGCFFANGPSDWTLTRTEIACVLFSGIVASALNYWLLTWSNKMLGPSLVALYMPLQPLTSSILSRIFLKSSLYLGSGVGGGLIILGLYLVTWGQRKGERLALTSLRRMLNTPHYMKGESSLKVNDPPLKVLYHRGPSNLSSPPLPVSQTWQPLYD
ncbi:unnamed protein product [Sphagnum troendelagicum]|uniref:WAT1-related protein n=1 Tax=Sphagnum troendelagicum TaxID=128251 RepID=A0ABP0U8X2_9BRYO